MTTEKPENTSLVASLISQFEAQIAALQTAVASLRAVQATGALGSVASAHVIGTAASASSAAAIDLPEGAFKNKSIPQCIELYLSTVGLKKKTNQEIADALKEGGVESTSDLGNSVNGALFKLKKLGKILRFKEGWGLASNYPAHIRGAATPTTSPRGKKKKSKKNGPKNAPTTTLSSGAAPTPKGKAGDRIMEVLRAKPDREYQLAEIAELAELGAKFVRLNLGKLIKAGRVRMSAPGTYVIARPLLVATGD